MMDAQFCSQRNCNTQQVEHNGVLVCPFHDIKIKDRTLMDKYMIVLGDSHNIRTSHISSVNIIDYFLRELIGKTDNIWVSVCQKDLSKVEGRYNDYLVLRHPQCTQPIYTDCSKNRPDSFHLSFREGVEKYKVFKALTYR